MILRAARLVIAASVALLGAQIAAAEDGKVQLIGENLPSELTSLINGALPKEEAPTSPLQARRQAERAARIARDALNSRAYFAAEVTPRVTGDGAPTPALLIETGPQFTLASIEIAYTAPHPGQPEPVSLLEDLPIEAGDVAFPEDVVASESQITDILRARGFAFANASERAVIGDREAGTLALTYRMDSGAKVAFGEVVYPPDVQVKASWLKRLEGFSSRDTYAPATLSRFNRRLAETRMFATSRASLAETPTSTLPDGRAVHDVIVRLEERARNTIALGASLSTDRGFGLSAEVERRNLTRRGDILTADLTVAQLERALEIGWERPHEFGYGRSLVFGATIAQEETDAFDRFGLDLSGGLEVRRNPRLNFGYGLEASRVRETLRLDGRSTGVVDRDVTLVNAYGAAAIDRSDNALDPRRGWRAQARLEPTTAFGGSDAQFLRAVGEVSGYLPFGEESRTVLAGRLRMGTAFGASLADLPTDRRFYSGGGGSVRGFAYQSIGPRTEDGDPVGGRSLAEVSAELRWQSRGSLGFVAFVDAGSVTDSEFGFDDLRTGAGFGVRYATPAGPIRADIAIPLDKTRFDDDVQVYIAIGQAF